MIAVVGQVGEYGVENFEAFENDGGVGVEGAEGDVAQEEVQLGNYGLSVILVVGARKKSVQSLLGRGGEERGGRKRLGWKMR